MLRSVREREIINILKANNGFATVNDLCKMLFTSESSIRRDLVSLKSQGLITRPHGGAELIKNYSNITPFNKRFNHNSEEKKIIAKKAKSLIKDGNIVFLDQSSSAFYIAAEIINNSTLTVVTNNIEIINLLSDSAIKLICSGGSLSNENRSCLVGNDAQKTFENIYADIVFFSTKSVSGDGIISDCCREEIFVRDSMLKNAHTKVFLCDSEKLNTKAPYKQTTLKEVDYIVCENNSANMFEVSFSELKILWHLAKMI